MVRIPSTAISLTISISISMIILISILNIYDNLCSTSLVVSLKVLRILMSCTVALSLQEVKQ